MPQNVLIIGGGIGGLALAHGLEKHNIPFHIYEKDESNHYRAQGYRIKISDKGTEALRYLFDEQTWSLLELTSAETRLGALQGIDAVTGEDTGSIMPAGLGVKPGAVGPFKCDFNPFKDPYAVDRTIFREVLLRGLPEYISYGHVFASYETNADDVTVTFDNGVTATGTIMVGADGARSAVRKQLSPEHPIIDTGGRLIYGKTPLTPEFLASVHSSVLKRMSGIKDMQQSSALSVVAEPVVFPNREAMESVGFRCPEDYLYWVIAAQHGAFGWNEDTMPHLLLDEAEQLALHVSRNWHPSIRIMIEEQAHQQTSVLPVYSVKPELGTWTTDLHVTLIGDAVHLISPAGGQGAVTSLRDAHTLCQLLAEQGYSDNTVSSYEQHRRQYAREAVEVSCMASSKIFGMKPVHECREVTI